MNIHVVQRGETLWALAQRYGVKAQHIVDVNGLTRPDLLINGQSLVIPTADPIHLVKAGESLWQIANRYNTTPQIIVQANQLSTANVIQIGQRLIIPSRSRPLKEVNAYITNLGSRGQQMIETVGKHLTYLSPFSYESRSDGSLIPLNDMSILNSARSQHVSPLLTISNIDGKGFNSNTAHVLLNNTAVQEALLNNIQSTLDTKRFRGLNVDFEYIYPEDREAYNRFLKRLIDRLHPLGYFVSSAVAPKISSSQKGLLYEAHDYPFHGQHLDFVILMTYEWGWAGGPPMAIAPLNMVKRVVNYAVTAIPRQKIMLGIPLYASDWTLPYVKGGPYAKTFSSQEAIRQAAQYHALIQYDHDAQSPFYRYFDEHGREHEVWFEDARSMQAKFDLVKNNNLRGISYWVLPSTFQQVWPVQEGNFSVVKYP